MILPIVNGLFLGGSYFSITVFPGAYCFPFGTIQTDLVNKVKDISNKMKLENVEIRELSGFLWQRYRWCLGSALLGKKVIFVPSSFRDISLDRQKPFIAHTLYHLKANDHLTQSATLALAATLGHLCLKILFPALNPLPLFILGSVISILACNILVIWQEKQADLAAAKVNS